MTEQEIRELLQDHGWYLAMPRKYNTRYGYAKRREGQRVLSRYLCTENKFSELTRDRVLRVIGVNEQAESEGQQS